MMQGFAGCSPGTAQLAPCPSGEIRKNGACVPDNLRVEIGYGNPVMLVSEGGELQVRRGFQGLVDALIGFRLTGFRPNAEVSVTIRMLFPPSGEEIIPEKSFNTTFAEVAPGVNEQSRAMTIFASASAVLGQEVEIFVRVQDVDDPSLTASLEQTVVLVEQN
jgi:hypothetical protein